LKRGFPHSAEVMDLFFLKTISTFKEVKEMITIINTIAQGNFKRKGNQ
jgi:hypothetical protein